MSEIYHMIWIYLRSFADSKVHLQAIVCFLWNRSGVSNRMQIVRERTLAREYFLRSTLKVFCYRWAAFRSFHFLRVEVASTFYQTDAGKCPSVGVAILGSIPRASEARVFSRYMHPRQNTRSVCRAEKVGSIIRMLLWLRMGSCRTVFALLLGAKNLLRLIFI